jgi:ABC-2 type transport system permease protein
MPMLLLGAICLPAVIIAVIASVTKVDKLPVEYTAYVLNVQLLVMVYVAGQAPASVSRDLRFRVVSLYFSRPLERIDYVVAKYAALTTAVFLLMALPLTILFVGALLAKLSLTDQLPDYLRSMAGAGLVALVLAGLALVIAALTPRRGLGVAAIIAVLAVSSGLQHAVQEIAVHQNQDTFAGYAGLLSPFSLVHGVQHALLGAKNALPADPPGAIGALVFLGTMVLLVAGCFGALVLRYRKVSI